MDDLVDLLKFIVPLVIFVGAAVFGKSNKQKAQSDAGQSALSSIFDFSEDELDTDTVPHTVQYSDNDRQSHPYEESEPPMPEEGVRSVFNETPQAVEAEPDAEKIGFDAREAVIYSTILERKY